MVFPSVLQIENPKCLSRTILAANDSNIRCHGASGGIVSEIIRHLFSVGMVQTAISFSFNRDDLFVPHLIYSFEDYRQVGSIYHEINIANFLRINQAAIKGAIVIVCLPCQIAAVRRQLVKGRTPHFIISLFCSGQQTKEATHRYFANIGVNRNDIICFSYRGEGWPSGIRITTLDGTVYFDPNMGGNWGKFRTPPFCLRRCFSCVDTFGVHADITAGDPWLKKYIETESVGLSMIGTLTLKGESVIQSMIESGVLTHVENVDEAVFVGSQSSAIVAKFVKRNTLSLQRLFYRLSDSHLYRRYILNPHLGLHNSLYKWFKRYVYIILRAKLLVRLTAK